MNRSYRRSLRRVRSGEQPLERGWRVVAQRAEAFLTAAQPVLQTYALFQTEPVQNNRVCDFKRSEYLQRRWEKNTALAEIKGQRIFLEELGAPTELFRGAKVLASHPCDDIEEDEDRQEWAEAAVAVAQGLPVVDPEPLFEDYKIDPSHGGLSDPEKTKSLAHHKERLKDNVAVYVKLLEMKKKGSATDDGRTAEEIVDGTESVDSDAAFSRNKIFSSSETRLPKGVGAFHGDVTTRLLRELIAADDEEDSRETTPNGSETRDDGGESAQDRVSNEASLVAPAPAERALPPPIKLAATTSASGYFWKPEELLDDAASGHWPHSTPKKTKRGRSSDEEAEDVSSKRAKSCPF